MFKKVLIANRGEIAVRIVRACRDMGIATVALYDASDSSSLHVRLADECVELRSELGYLDQDRVLEIARQTGAEAIHPGYGFLAERPDFIDACEKAGIVFIGPPAQVIATLQHKIEMLERARGAGFVTTRHSQVAFDSADDVMLRAEAERVGYPLVVKSYSGGRGHGTRLLRSPDKLVEVVRRAQAEAHTVFADQRIYLEHAILPSRYIEVQILADNFGNLLYLGERDGSIQRNHHKVIEESPAPYLSDTQRERLAQMAVAIARLFELRSACSIEFLMDQDGAFYFTEIKPRIQVEHPISEMISQVDIVREQIRIAADLPLTLFQSEVRFNGWAMQCHINAEDPWNNFLPSPGRLRRFRLPGGPDVRVDTYAYTGCEVPVGFDRLLAKVVVWGHSRDECLNRMRRALEDFAISGIQTNLPLIQKMLDHPEFVNGEYTSEFARHSPLSHTDDPVALRDLAVAAAIAYVGRTMALRPAVSERTLSGWHRNSRRLPE